MFSGKTDELIRRFEVGVAGGRDVIALKPARDDRHPRDEIVSHSLNRIAAVSVSSASEIVSTAAGQSLVVIDEIQFFDDALRIAVDDVRAAGSDVLAVGLDYDFRGEAFAATRALMSDASRVSRLAAVCGRCESPATLTQRLTNGRPSALDAPRLVVGDRDIYQPRCERCWREERGETDR